jgi:hypothetical protein
LEHWKTSSPEDELGRLSSVFEGMVVKLATL